MADTPHIALPLKYRPMTFDDVVGQEHVVRTLRHAIESGRIANAYLFIGPRGIGKTTLSRIFAKALNCTSPRGVEPCGECTNCREIAAGRSIDVTELDAASHNKVEDVKPIIEQCPFRPTASKYKIYIVDECHMLSGAAWNALLKTLEEPPPHVRFIFATTEGDKVLATIVSRCQRFDLRRIQTHDIVSRLKHVCAREGVEAEEDALLAIARGAEGGMRDALSSLDQLISFKGDRVTEEDALGVFGLVSRRALEGLAGAILKGDTAAILGAVETFDSAGKNMRRISGELLQHFRNLVVLQALGPQAKALAATPDQVRVLEEQAQGVDPGRVFRVCDQLAEMEDKLRHVLSARTLIEMSLLRASRLATTATVDELLRAVKAMKEKRPRSEVEGEKRPRSEVEVEKRPRSEVEVEKRPRPEVEVEKRPRSEVEGENGKSTVLSQPQASTSTSTQPQASTSTSTQPQASTSTQPQASTSTSPSRLMDDPVLNGVVESFAGATVAEVYKEGEKK